MSSWQKVIVSSTTKIRDTLKTIDDSSLQIALVCNDQKQLVGTVTDGDVRRGILRGYDLDSPVELIMNRNPVTSLKGTSERILKKMMVEKRLHHIPVVDEDGQLVDLVLLDRIIDQPSRDNWVLLMAGGLGTRLRPLTENCPKPLLKVGSKPILETILESFVEHGFHRFFISVNYKAEMITEYFGDGLKWGVQIEYLHETKRLGTAGPLSLLPEMPDKPLIIMNGDLLTKVNYQQLIDFHEQHGATGTMCVREFTYQIPYGVTKIEDHMLLGIEEKPLQKYFVSAGIYVLSPEALNYIPNNAFYDMPSLFDTLIQLKRQTMVYPIREYWLDIGRFEEYEKANGEYEDVFGSSFLIG